MSEDDYAKISALDQNARFFNPKNFSFWKNLPYFEWEFQLVINLTVFLIYIF